MVLSAQAQSVGQSPADNIQPNTHATNHFVADEPPPLDFSAPPSHPRSDPSDLSPSDHRKWTSYADAVRKALSEAILANSKTVSASLDAYFAIWIDQKGHVTQVEMPTPSGDADLYVVLRNEIILRLTFPEPPSDMPMPVKAHIQVRR